MKYLLIVCCVAALTLLAYAGADRVLSTYQLYLVESGGPSKITLAPPSLSSDWTLTLPTAGGTNNYALTTNGSGTTSWAQISLTAAVTGVLPIANGGTNKALTLSAGGIPYFDADSFEVLSAGSSGKPLISGGSGAPSFATLGISGGGTNNASLDVTSGNLVYTDGSKMNVVTIGTTGQVLTVSGGSPLWQSWGGTWTPTLTNGTNTAASTTRQGNWVRSKDSICASFAPDWDPTASSTATYLDATLPVASAFTSDLVDAAGGCVWNGGTNNGVCNVVANSAQDRITIAMSPATTANATAWVWFCYAVK